MIKAIETSYCGYRFRSRLEARWAVFFDALEIPWEYEREGFDLDGAYYLPDFYLPTLKIWAEVKPSRFSRIEFAKIAALKGLVLDGLPEVRGYIMAGNECSHGGGDGPETYCFDCYCKGECSFYAIDFVWSHHKGRLWFLFGQDPGEGLDYRYQGAVEASRWARF